MFLVGYGPGTRLTDRSNDMAEIGPQRGHMTIVSQKGTIFCKRMGEALNRNCYAQSHSLRLAFSQPASEGRIFALLGGSKGDLQATSVEYLNLSGLLTGPSSALFKRLRSTRRSRGDGHLAAGWIRGPARRGGGDSGNAAGLADGDGTHALEGFAHLPRETADGPVLDPLRNGDGLGGLELFNGLLLLFEVAGELDLGLDGPCCAPGFRGFGPVPCANSAS